MVKGYTKEQIDKLDDKAIEHLVKESPYYKATSADIDWVSKVQMQGAIQKWVDHSISVTVNIPKETSEEIVSTIYQTAWESGCKGCTIYREGSRNGVLVSNKESKNKCDEHFVESKAPKRPKKLEAEVVRFKNDREDWIAVVGMYEGRPYEIFTGKAESFPYPRTWRKAGSSDAKRLDKNMPATTSNTPTRTATIPLWKASLVCSRRSTGTMPSSSAASSATACLSPTWLISSAS